MFSRFSAARKALARLAALAAAAVLVAACQPIQFGGLGRSAPDGPTIDARAPIPVALLVPRSGGDRNAALAQSLENAARLAIEDLDGVTIDLRVYDTAADASVASTAAARAVNEGARIIIGPVFASAANAAGAAAAGAGINVLAFSNNPDIAGGNVFILGNTFQNTANRLVGYSVAKGRDDIFIVHGNDVAENAGRAAIAAAASRSGANVVGTASFELSQQGVVQAIPGAAQQIKASGAEALFLTSGTAGALPFLADLLPGLGVKTPNPQFVGLQRLDIPSSALSLRGLQGAWFALPDPGPANQFAQRYTARYGSAPHPIAGLAYDGIAAIGALVRGQQSAALSASALTQGSGFAGTGGIFRFRPDGTVERGLAVAQIVNNQVTVIDPAPRSFGGAGF